MSGPTSTGTDRELRFQKFTRRLLQAQNYDFLYDRLLFSPETLKSILQSFCDIIADDLDAESCTVQLQLYATGDLQWTGKEAEKFLRQFPFTDASPHCQQLKSTREQLLEDPLIFPYWFYPKGALRLVAANQAVPDKSDDDAQGTSNQSSNGAGNGDGEFGSPWNRILMGASALIGGDERLKTELQSAVISELVRGISTDVVQDNAPRVPDRRELRGTRDFRKLGAVDHLIWTGEAWSRMFRSYYGVPIRIHSQGEVIGILKVENKRDTESSVPGSWPRAAANAGGRQSAAYISEREVGELLKHIVNGGGSGAVADVVRGQLLDWAGRYDSAGGSHSGENPTTPPSLFAIAYLDADLKQAEWVGLSAVSDYISIPCPYATPAAKPLVTANQIATLIPADRTTRPPMQVVFENCRDEELLCEWIGAGAKNVGSFTIVNRFYSALSDATNAVSFTGNAQAGIDAALHAALLSNSAAVKYQVAVERREESGLPWYDVIITCIATSADGKVSELPVKFHLTVFPTPSDLASQPEDVLMRKANESWVRRNADDALKSNWNNVPDGPRFRRQGERVAKLMSDGTVERATDFILDRWAARVQAFVDALPLPDFSPEDAHKLSWAAFEIGKVIEREISYRANHSDDHMPLTAMEFFRIPISDLSFVDDLKARRRKAESLKSTVDHHMASMLTHQGLSDHVAYNSRIKEYRSTLLRLGERCDGYRRGNLAIWLFLLHKFVGRRGQRTTTCVPKGALRALARKLPDSRASFFAHLADFGERLEAQLSQLPTAIAAEAFDIISGASRANPPLYLDLKFDSFPFAVSTADCDKRPSEDDKLDKASRVLQRALNQVRPHSKLRHGRANARACVAIQAVAEDREFRAELADRVLRNCDDFSRYASSLLIQILNLLNIGPKYQAFYRASHELRRLLCTSPRDIEDDPENAPLKEIFYHENNRLGHGHQPPTTWMELESFIAQNSTEDVFGPAQNISLEDSELCLSARSIYKRLRTLNHVLRRQRSAASLDWELGRFDLLGCRCDCLLKGEVFAAYERAWESGDPFLKVARSAESIDDYAESAFTQLMSKSRMRWLCLRTSVFQGNYNAVQIAALMDPNCTRAGYWDDTALTPVRIRAILSELVKEYDPQFWSQYCTFSFHRARQRKGYEKWNKLATAIGPGLHLKPSGKLPAYLSVGSFVFEGVVDLLIYVLTLLSDDLQSQLRGRLRRRAFTGPIGTLKLNVAACLKAVHSILERLCTACLDGVDYVKRMQMWFEGRPDRDDSSWNCVRGACDTWGKNGSELYSQAADLVSILKQGDQRVMRHEAPQLETFLDRLVNNLKKEAEDLFGNLLRPAAQIQESVPPELLSVPVFFLGTDAPLVLQEVKRRLSAWSSSLQDLDTIQWLIDKLKQLRRVQKDFMLWKGRPQRLLNSTEERSPGLWLRGKNEVLARMMNLVCLYDASAFEGKIHRHSRRRSQESPLYRNLTPYDLFYYLRSMIPVEMQFRTRLASTVADQYHSAVYKGHPPPGTEIERAKLDEMGSQIDHIDREIEIDYEDYVSKYYFNLE